jgi:colicin import membrane protein
MTATAAVFEERGEPGAFASALMSAAVHLLLLAVLIFGVRWQNRPPEAVEVELWLPPPPAPVVEAPKPEPAPKVEPPKVEPAPPKPEPVIPKPEIVEQKAPPPKPKPVPKVEHKPEPPKPKPVAKAEPKPKPEPPKAVAKPAPPREDETRRVREQMARELAREQASLQIDRERDNLNNMAREASAKALAGWIEKVRAKIRGNVMLPQDIKGNPEAIFDVVQLPSGEVLSAKLRKSSGHRGYDDAVERAILKSSPLPKPDRPDQFRRDLELRFRPLD